MTLFDQLLDASVIESFDQRGYERHSRSFSSTDFEKDLTDRIALITGANSGIGFATALELARRNATVYLLCRNPQRAQDAVERIVAETQSSTVHWKQVDLSDLQSVHKTSTDILDSVDGSIDIFIQNAGVLPIEESRSPQGYEMTLATNLLGHHLMTQILWKKLTGRMILVSSGGMYMAPLSTKQLFAQKFPKFDGVRRYALTKRAQVALTEVYALMGASQGLTVHCMHPGWVATPGVEHSLPGFWKRMEHRLRTPLQGADTVIWLSIADAATQSSGLFWFDRSPRKTHILPWQSHKSSEVKALWKQLEKVVTEFV